jgi:anti-sigma regulatory factor (Ser/Thr protein kinase)
MAPDPDRAATRPLSGRCREPPWSTEAAAILGNVSGLRRAVVAFAADHGAGDRTQTDIALAVSEAITNSVVHAYVDTVPGTVRLQATITDDRLRVTISDDGHGMSPRLDSPGLGLGLAIMAPLVASLSIAPGPDGRGTVVAMVFTLP